jgi:hypothetical protein
MGTLADARPPYYPAGQETVDDGLGRYPAWQGTADTDQMQERLQEPLTGLPVIVGGPVKGSHEFVHGGAVESFRAQHVA